MKNNDGVYKCYDLPQHKKAEITARGNHCLLCVFDANVRCLQYRQRSDVASLQPIDQLVQHFSSFYQLKSADVRCGMWLPVKVGKMWDRVFNSSDG